MRGLSNCSQSTGQTFDFRIRAPSAMACSSCGPAVGRAFYCFLVGKRVVVLHALIKKTQQTPDRELKLARKRMKELEHG